ADGAVARQAAQTLGPEHVGHPAHRLLGMEVDAVGGRDARGLLAAMLERVESEVRDVAGLRMVPDAEQPALVVEPVVLTPCGAQIRSSTRVRSGPARHPRSSWLRAGARAGCPRWSRSTATGWPTPPSEPRTHALRPEQGDTVTRALEPLGRPPPRVLQDADHPNDRCRQDRLAAGLIVEGNVAAHYRDLEGAARLGDAVDRLGELPENLRPLGRAEVHAIGHPDGRGARAGDVARRLADRHGGAPPRVQDDVAPVAVGGDRE